MEKGSLLLYHVGLFEGWWEMMVVLRHIKYNEMDTCSFERTTAGFVPDLVLVIY